MSSVEHSTLISLSSSLFFFYGKKGKKNDYWFLRRNMEVKVVSHNYENDGKGAKHFDVKIELSEKDFDDKLK